MGERDQSVIMTIQPETRKKEKKEMPKMITEKEKKARVAAAKKAAMSSKKNVMDAMKSCIAEPQIVKNAKNYRLAVSMHIKSLKTLYVESNR